MSMARDGIVLFAHGARDPRWAAPFEDVAAQVRRLRPDADVRLAFLELMAPTLEEAACALAAAGCTRVAVVPMFLGAGGHVRNDLPRIVEALRSRHAGVAFSLHAPIGEAPPVIAAMAAAAAASPDTPDTPDTPDVTDATR
jgi:sirohydrochlorin cobaltochelatase